MCYSSRMKINFGDYDMENFLVKDGFFCNEYTKLVQPSHIGTKFTQKNKIFRSSIWSFDGELLSGSWLKFVNFGENPAEFPVPVSIDGWTFVEKIDGSCVIVDFINGQFSARTRGTFTYRSLETYADVDLMMEKYPLIKKFVQDNPQYSLLLELVTPNMKIVLNYGDIDIYLCGCVNKIDYSLLTQSELDIVASKLGVKRPSYYTFSSVQDLISQVEQWTGKEGVVAYSPCGQHLLKIKSEWYRKIHAAKESFRNIESVVDVWFVFGKPDYTTFVQKFTETYDYETLLICQGFISRICDGYKQVQQIVSGMQRFVDETLCPLPNRREQAEKVLSSYGPTNRSQFVFALLDRKPLTDDQLKKLMFQCLKH